jgi:hypothetical protein
MRNCIHEQSSRYALNGVHVCQRDKDRVWVTATDGRILSVTSAKGESEKPEVCPANILPKKGKKDSLAQLNGQWETTSKDGTVSSPKIEGRYPNCAAMFSDKRGPASAESVTVVRLNANLLAKLANSISTGGVVTLIIGSPDKPIGVMGSDGFGIIMPAERGQHAGELDADCIRRLCGEYNKLAEEYKATFKPVA